MKALVLSSGGLDSTTCLALAVQRFGAAEVLALSVFYGQKHQKELQSAKAVAAYYGVAQQTLDLSAVFETSDCSLLQGRAAAPHESYAKQQQAAPNQPVSTYVPFRNGLFIAAAASAAEAARCSYIYYGAHLDDAAGNAYPDCSAAFYRAMNEAIKEGTGGHLKLVAPFIETDKAGVVKQGISLGVPYELTWSCYEGGDKPCGQCGTCRDRLRAFAVNGIKDPLQYEEEHI